MSQSPSAGSQPTQSYLDGWRATYELVRRGKSWSGHERNCCFLNTGSERFADVSAAAGLDHEIDGRALAVVDWDQDGALDLVATARSGPRVRLLHNTGTPGHHHLALRLVDDGANRDAIGARVDLVAGGRAQMRTVTAGSGFLSLFFWVRWRTYFK